MTDKTFTDRATIFYHGVVVDGLFKYKTSADGSEGDPQTLDGTDGPPIEISKVAAADKFIVGWLVATAKQNEIVSLLTPFTAVIAVTCGGTVTRGTRIKYNSDAKVVDATSANAGTVDGTYGTVEAEVIKANRSRIGEVVSGNLHLVALQSGSNNDVIYAGVVA